MHTRRQIQEISQSDPLHEKSFEGSFSGLGWGKLSSYSPLSNGACSVCPTEEWSTRKSSPFGNDELAVVVAVVGSFLYEAVLTAATISFSSRFVCFSITSAADWAALEKFLLGLLLPLLCTFGRVSSNIEWGVIGTRIILRAKISLSLSILFIFLSSAIYKR